MLVYLNQDVNFNDYVEDGKRGQVIEVSEEVGKKIIMNGYGHEVELVKFTPKTKEKEATEKDLNKDEIKAILNEKGIKYDSKAKKEEL